MITKIYFSAYFVTAFCMSREGITKSIYFLKNIVGQWRKGLFIIHVVKTFGIFSSLGYATPCDVIVFAHGSTLL